MDKLVKKLMSNPGIDIVMNVMGKHTSKLVRIDVMNVMGKHTSKLVRIDVVMNVMGKHTSKLVRIDVIMNYVIYYESFL